jgi:hypothetical protein
MAALTAKSNGRNLTLAALAEAKHLPADSLRELGLHDLPQGGVGIPYYGPAGEEIAVQRRTALKAKDGSYWPKGTPLTAYGQWRLDRAKEVGFLILVEGESDCWALWQHKLPALGIPGAGATKVLQREHVESISTVYVHREPDQGGARFVEGVRERLAALGFAGKAFELRMPEAVKDPADLHAADPERLLARLQSAITASTPLPLRLPPAPDHYQRADGGRTTARAQEGVTVEPPPWEAPVPLDAVVNLPHFPLHHLPDGLGAWAEAEAEATQTPPDLAAMLTLAACGAALAKKVRVCVRPGWPEPTNVFTVTALPSGERKSAVFRDAIAPVQEFERQEQARLAPEIAEAATEHRILEKRLKVAEDRAAKAGDDEEREQIRQEARQLATELAAHVVPESPRLYCDDETPESLGKLVAEQGGRMLQASPEGTAFEIAKGRYSDQGRANFDVYLKGHAGDPLRVGRVSRGRDVVDDPALSVALAVQPDVVRGLAEHTTMKTRGFLARFLYSLPLSLVGRRKPKPQPVPDATADAYRAACLALWELPGAVDTQGRPAAHLLSFSPAADQLMEDFQVWLEPQLADGEELSCLSGWAQKLAGAVARIAGILHMAAAVGSGSPWMTPISDATVSAAIGIGRDYLLPHARASFGLMGADERLEDARAVAAWLLRKLSEHSEHSERGVPSVSRRDVHQAFRGRLKTATAVDPVIRLLVDYGYLRPLPQPNREGPGQPPSPRYEVNPLLPQCAGIGAGSHNPQNTQNQTGHAATEDSEHSEDCERGVADGDTASGATESLAPDDQANDSEVL